MAPVAAVGDRMATESYDRTGLVLLGDLPPKSGAARRAVPPPELVEQAHGEQLADTPALQHDSGHGGAARLRPSLAKLTSQISANFKDLKGAAKPLVRDLKGAAKPLVRDLKGAAKPLMRDLKGAAKPLVRELKGVAKGVAQPLVDDLRGRAQPLVRDLRGLAETYLPGRRGGGSGGHSTGGRSVDPRWEVLDVVEPVPEWMYESANWELSASETRGRSDSEGSWEEVAED